MAQINRRACSEKYLNAENRTSAWLKTVTVTRRDDITFVQCGVDLPFSARSEKDIEHELAQKREQWFAQGIISPDQSSWKGIGA